MIQANELRIGNICSIYGKTTVITLQDLRFIDSDNKNPKNKGINIQPIPITEEWLLSLGLRKKTIQIVELLFVKMGFILEKWGLKNLIDIVLMQKVVQTKVFI